MTLKRFIIAVLVIFVGLCIFLGSLYLKFSRKEPITEQAFLEALEHQGAAVTEREEDITSPVVECAWQGTTEHFQLVFFVLTTEDVARSLFAHNRELLAEKRGAHSSVALSHYSNYRTTADGGYYHIARIKNTVL